MIQIIDFTNCPDGFENYGGSDSKQSIEYIGQNYLLKLPSSREKKTNLLQTSHVNNVISEYIGSHIVSSLGIDAHETLLGTYNNSFAVACKDFNGNGYYLQEFSGMMLNMYLPSEIGKIPSYHQLYEVIQTHPKLAGIREQAIARYWDTFIADALIGNFDRHKGNWGYLVNPKTRDVKLAPVYDCGSCLYPALSEDVMKSVINSREEIERRIYEFPKVALNKIDNPKRHEKFTYQELLTPGTDKNATEALKRIYPNIDMGKIFKIIEDIPILSDIRIEFYETMLQNRKELLLDHSLELVQKYEYDEKVKNILNSIRGTSYLPEESIQFDRDRNEVIIFPGDRESASVHINASTRDVKPYLMDQQISFGQCAIQYPETMKMIQKVKAVLNDNKQTIRRDNILEEQL